MKINDAYDAIRMAARNNLNLALLGSPGIGKTDIIKKGVEDEGVKMHIAHPVTWDSIDGRGMPITYKDDNGKQIAEFIPFGDMSILFECNDDLVFFFDDVGQAAPSVQAVIMQIALERKLNGMIVKPNIRIMLASNRRQDGAGVAGLLTPLINRFAMITVEPDANEWVKWAIAKGKDGKSRMPVELASFLRFRPDLISTFEPKKAKDSPFASPRSIAMLGSWMKAGMDKLNSKGDALKPGTLEIWAGCVGDAFATEFAAYYINFKSIASLPDRIMQNPDNAPIPESPAMIYALCGALAYRAKDANIDSIYRYSNRLTKEFQVALMTDIGARNEDLMNSAAFMDFYSNNMAVI